ncbi:MAG TPA: TonB-dependent receptor [Terriglobales bacterium]|nr:TonB-dependent receptor [Terriglobales bacterium]
MKPKLISVFDPLPMRGSGNPIRSVSPRKDLDNAVKRLTQRFLIGFLLAGIASLSLWAQVAGGTAPGEVQVQKGSGTIAGRATDPGHNALQGARVELQPTGLTSVSDDQGQFTLTGVPPGNYTLTVSYIGFSPFSAPVTVAAGKVLQVDALLPIGSVSEEVIVRGERERGELEALNRERTADTIMEVLPAEVITSLPNTNVADALGRLPGVSLERDEGEGKYVQIRGTEPRLSNVTINGVHVSSPERDVRNVKLDIIPADLVESIEVSKTLSANQDGDAIGGSINLVTRSADDEPYYSITGMAGYTPIVNGRWLTEEDATFTRRLGPEKRLGIAIGGSYDFNGRGYNNIEPAPGTQDFGNGPVPVYTGIHLREYIFRRNRYGFAGTGDYHLHNGTAYVRGLFSEFKDFGDTWNVNESLGNLTSPTTSDNTGNVVIRHLNRTPEQRIYSVAAGENLSVGQNLLTYQFAVSRERQDGQFPSAYFNGPSNVAFGINTTNPTTPKFPVLNGININDPTLYSFNHIIGAVDPVRELDLEGSVSFARHYLFGSHSGSFELGTKIRNGNKKNVTYEPVYDSTGSPALPYTQVLGDAPKDPNFYFGQYSLPPLSNYNKILDFLAANPGAEVLNVDSTRARSDPNNYHTIERIYAGYAMNTLNFGRTRIETGVRIEATQSNFTGYHVTFDVNGNYVSTTPVLGSNDYVNVLPSVNVQYAFTPNTDIRAGYGRGIARPNFADLPPYILQDDSNQQILVGNPNLKPTTANNFDILGEHYLKPVGIIQAGVFYKDMQDPIFPVTTLITSGTNAGFQQVQPVNGTTAHILGMEASYRQLFTFLPGFANGFGLAVNYSYTTSKAAVPGRRVDPALSRQGPNNWNLNVTYDKRRLSARLGLTHNDAYIYQYNYADGAPLGTAGPNGDVYTYAHTQLDAQASYRLRSRLKLIVSLLNLNNEVFGFYQGSPIYPTQREFYSPSYAFGLRWSNSKE